MMSCSETEGPLSYVLLSEIGANHCKINLPNQDAIAIKCLEEDFCIAVSDGVGSCKKSDIGSKRLVEVCMSVFEDICNGILSFNNAEVINTIISEWKKAIGADIDNYCSTLKLVVKKGSIAKCISLGDGLIVITSEGANYITPYENYEFTNETRCLDSLVSFGDFHIRDFYIDLYKRYVVFVCTDGISNGIQEGTEIELVREIENSISADDLQTELIDLLEDISKYNMDDKTMGVVKYER